MMDKWEQGRCGEILQYWWFHRMGCDLQDLADRTKDRAPLLHGSTSLIAPDTAAIKTAEFFLEFKTKRHHEQWNGGSKDDDPKIAARIEEGIDTDKLQHYQEAQRRWRKPVVLSILSIMQAEIIASPLDQLGEPRRSPHPDFPLVNWDVRKFARLAQFDDRRLMRFFDPENPRSSAIRKRWCETAPRFSEVSQVLDALKPQQAQFDEIRQWIFDVIEREWHECPA